MSTIEELLAFGSDRNAYENRIKDIIIALRGASKQRYFIASFPFFNRTNNIVYSLIHCSGNIKGFKLYKRTAWKIFEGKSSAKKTYGKEHQLMFSADGTYGVESHTDEYCYNIFDIAEYLQQIYKGKQNVPKNTVWETLDEHPIFPSEGYKQEILKILKDEHRANVSKQTISFSD